MRIEYFPAAAFAAGAPEVLEGKLLAQMFSTCFAIDNMEGLTAVRDEALGGTLLYVLSDDNHSSEQRTVLQLWLLRDDALVDEPRAPVPRTVATCVEWTPCEAPRHSLLMAAPFVVLAAAAFATYSGIEVYREVLAASSAPGVRPPPEAKGLALSRQQYHTAGVARV